MVEDCVFCKIRKGELPSTTLYKDEEFMIPTSHVPYIDMMTEEGTQLLGRIMGKISHMQEELGITNGYRLIIDQGEDAEQTIKHVHIHILGGEKLKNFK